MQTAPLPARPQARANPRLPSRFGEARRVAGILSRSLAAILGGYGLAALSAMALAVLPGRPEEAVLWGMLLSFAVMAGAVVWCFAARSALAAWCGLLAPALPLAAFLWLGRGGGA